MAYAIVITITDADGDEDAFVTHVANAVPYAAALNYAYGLIPLVDGLTEGAITRLSITRSQAVPAGLQSPPLDLAESRIRGSINFVTTTPHSYTLDMPTFSRAKFSKKSINTADAQYQAFVNALLSGIAVDDGDGGTVTVTATDRYGNGLVRVKRARKTHSTRRKRVASTVSVPPLLVDEGNTFLASYFDAADIIADETSVSGGESYDVTDTAGLAMGVTISSLSALSADASFGFDTATDTTPDDLAVLLKTTSNALRARINSSNSDALDTAAANDRFVLVNDGNGLGVVLVNDEVVWLGETTNALNKAVVSALPAELSISHVGVVQAGAGWADGSVRTDAIAGAAANNESFSHEADFMCIVTVNLPDAANYRFRYRRVTDNDCWELLIASSGVISLRERTSGVITSRDSGTISDGDTLRGVMIGNSHKWYANGTEIISYDSAQHATETAGVIADAGTGGTGSIADLHVYPRTPSGNDRAAVRAMTDVDPEA